MPKTAVSVTLGSDNLLWLRGRARLLKRRSLSETLDQLVSAARAGGDVPAASIRSVVGTVDIAADDPNLKDADRAVRAWLSGSASGPLGSTGRRSRRRRG